MLPLQFVDEMKSNLPTSLETPRLKLRMFEEKDWQPLCAMFADEEWVRYTTQVPLEDWQTWRTLATYLGHWQLRGYGPYAVVEKASGELIGPVGLWYPGGDRQEPEIKWAVAKPFWGKGFATEAAAAVRDLAKQCGWQRLISLILVDNERSKAVAVRLGGQYEKTVLFRTKLTSCIYGYDLSK